MGGRLCCFLLVLQLLSWVCVTSSPFPPNDDHVPPQPPPAENQSSHSLQVSLSSKKGWKSRGGGTKMEEGILSNNKGVRKIGSSPPNCDHKCYECSPCEAIQVPAPTNYHFGVQYTNYEPEGWKCKCGPFFYSP